MAAMQLSQHGQRASHISQSFADGVELPGVWVSGTFGSGPVLQRWCVTHQTAGIPGDERFECAGCEVDREIAVSRARTRFNSLVAALSKE